MLPLTVRTLDRPRQFQQPKCWVTGYLHRIVRYYVPMCKRRKDSVKSRSRAVAAPLREFTMNQTLPSNESSRQQGQWDFDEATRSQPLHSSRFGAPNGLPGLTSLFKFLAVPNIYFQGFWSSLNLGAPWFLGENGSITRNWLLPRSRGNWWCF